MIPTQVANMRRRLGLTQADLGKMLGRHQLTISKWERGELIPKGWDVEMLEVLEVVSALHDDLPVILSDHLRIMGAPSALHLVLSRRFAS